MRVAFSKRTVQLFHCSARLRITSLSLTLRNSMSSSLVRTAVAARAGSARLQRAYHERVIDHYNNPRNVGKFGKDEMADVGTGLVGAPACGDVMKLQLKIKDGKVLDAKFKTFGCGSAIASSSLATEWVKGKTVDECLEIKNTEIAQHLVLPPVKLHCSMLAEDAIRAAVKDWQTKNQSGSIEMPAATAGDAKLEA